MPEAIELLTPAETAALLGLRPGTLEIWRCTKRWPLNFIKIGGRVRYRRQDVEKFLAARTVVCGPQAATRVRRKRCG
jgi:excisionase family DNA binding protein